MMPVIDPACEASGALTLTPSTLADAVSHWTTESIVMVEPSELRATINTLSGASRFNLLKSIVFLLLKFVVTDLCGAMVNGSTERFVTSWSLLAYDRPANRRPHTVFPSVVDSDSPHPQDLRHTSILILRTNKRSGNEICLAIHNVTPGLRVEKILG